MCNHQQETVTEVLLCKARGFGSLNRALDIERVRALLSKRGSISIVACVGDDRVLLARSHCVLRRRISRGVPVEPLTRFFRLKSCMKRSTSLLSKSPPPKCVSLALAFLVVWRCESLKYADVFATACITFVSRYASAVSFTFGRTTEDISSEWNFLSSLMDCTWIIVLSPTLKGHSFTSAQPSQRPFGR